MRRSQSITIGQISTATHVHDLLLLHGTQQQHHLFMYVIATSTNLEDNLLNSELDFPLGVHDRVGSVEQHLLHVAQTLDLLLNDRQSC